MIYCTYIYIYIYIYYSKCGIFHDVPLPEGIPTIHVHFKIFQDGKFGWYSIHLHSTKRASSLPRGPPSALVASGFPKDRPSPGGDHRHGHQWPPGSPHKTRAFIFSRSASTSMSFLPCGNLKLSLHQNDVPNLRGKINDYQKEAAISGVHSGPFRSIHIHTPTLKTHLFLSPENP